MSTACESVSEHGQADKTTRFLSDSTPAHASALMAAFDGLRKERSAGVDEVTYRDTSRTCGGTFRRSTIAW